LEFVSPRNFARVKQGRLEDRSPRAAIISAGVLRCRKFEKLDGEELRRVNLAANSVVLDFISLAGSKGLSL
jgi:hypothetical protein